MNLTTFLAGAAASAVTRMTTVTPQPHRNGDLIQAVMTCGKTYTEDRHIHGERVAIHNLVRIMDAHADKCKTCKRRICVRNPK